MKTYNRALDYTALALNELTKGNHVLAARLLAKAANESDVTHAIQILEASNAQAFALQAKTQSAKVRKVTASDEVDLEDDEEIMELDGDVEQDPLDDIEDDEDGDDAEDDDTEVTAKVTKTNRAAEMQAVLAKMVRRSGRR